MLQCVSVDIFCSINLEVRDNVFLNFFITFIAVFYAGLYLKNYMIFNPFFLNI